MLTCLTRSSSCCSGSEERFVQPDDTRSVTGATPPRKLRRRTTKVLREMRHLVGVVLAIVMAAAVFFAASWGFLRLGLGSARLATLPGGGGSLFSDRNLLEGFGAVLGVGLLAGIMMAAPRISP